MARIAASWINNGGEILGELLRWLEDVGLFFFFFCFLVFFLALVT